MNSFANFFIFTFLHHLFSGTQVLRAHKKVAPKLLARQYFREASTLSACLEEQSRGPVCILVFLLWNAIEHQLLLTNKLPFYMQRRGCQNLPQESYTTSYSVFYIIVFSTCLVPTFFSKIHKCLACQLSKQLYQQFVSTLHRSIFEQ